MYISCLDRGKKRDRARRGEFNAKMSRATAHKLETAAAEIKELDEEADCLCNTLEKIVADKKKQDYHLRLLKDEVERRKTNPLGVRLGPSPQEVKKKRERKAEEKAKEGHRMQEQRLRRELAEQIKREKELVKEKERRVKAARGAHAANVRINERPIPAEIMAAARAIAASRGRELPIGSDVLAAYRQAHCSRSIGAEHRMNQ